MNKLSDPPHPIKNSCLNAHSVQIFLTLVSLLSIRVFWRLHHPRYNKIPDKPLKLKSHTVLHSVCEFRLNFLIELTVKSVLFGISIKKKIHGKLLRIKSCFDVPIWLIHQKIALSVETNRITKKESKLTYFCGGITRKKKNPTKNGLKTIYSVCSSELLTALFQRLHLIN